MLGSEPVIDAQHAGARYIRDAPDEVTIVQARPKHIAAAVQIERVMVGARERSRNADAGNACGVHGGDDRALGWVRDKWLGRIDTAPQFANVRVVPSRALEKPAQREPQDFGAQAHWRVALAAASKRRRASRMAAWFCRA